MSKIKTILICGLGAIGGYYASILSQDRSITLKVLTDKTRYDKYKLHPRKINSKEYTFDYILPEDKSFKSDLIIIATKASGLEESIINIKNFITDKTIVMSFLNGITSEQSILNKYPNVNILYSYLLGHTFFRRGDEIKHDGHARIIFGSQDKDNKGIYKVKNLFDKNKILYEISDDIIKSQWLKFCFNCCVNQVSAVTGKTFGEMKDSKECIKLFKEITNEITSIADKIGISQTSDFYPFVLNSLDLMLPEGKTSMLQDIESGTTPEIEIFGETVCKLGKHYGIKTPYNRKLTEKIKQLS